MEREFDWKIAVVSLILAISLWYWVKVQRNQPPECPYPTNSSRIAIDRFKRCVERRQMILDEQRYENGGLLWVDKESP